AKEGQGGRYSQLGKELLVIFVLYRHAEHISRRPGDEAGVICPAGGEEIDCFVRDKALSRKRLLVDELAIRECKRALKSEIFQNLDQHLLIGVRGQIREMIAVLLAEPKNLFQQQFS